jgi:glycine cleavage system H protein
MTTLMEILEAVGTFILGTGGRFGLFFVAGLALLVPASAVALVIRAVQARRARRVWRDPGELAWRRGAYHAPNHTWLAPRRPGELAVGLDDLANRILPSVTAVELPRPGMAVHRGDPIAVLRAGERTIRIGAPVDGTVLRVNGAVRRDPGRVHREPYGSGWLFSMAPADGTYLSFPQDREAGGWLRSERLRLNHFIEAELGMAAADGGTLVEPLPTALGEEGWKKVVFAFLHAA